MVLLIMLANVLDVSIKNDTLVTIALCLFIVIAVIWLISTIGGHWPWHRP